MFQWLLEGKKRKACSKVGPLSEQGLLGLSSEVIKKEHLEASQRQEHLEAWQHQRVDRGAKF